MTEGREKETKKGRRGREEKGIGQEEIRQVREEEGEERNGQSTKKTKGGILLFSRYISNK